MPETKTEELKPAVAVKKSVTEDYIISLEDGRKFKSLKRHLAAEYGMTPEQYRVKWGLADQLSYGGACLCQTAVVAGEVVGPRPQAGECRLPVAPPPPSRCRSEAAQTRRESGLTLRQVGVTAADRCSYPKQLLRLVVALKSRSNR